MLENLPVHKILPQLKETLTQQGRAVLMAPPGSGKTTLVPLALKDAPWLKGKNPPPRTPEDCGPAGSGVYEQALPGKGRGYCGLSDPL